MNSVDGISARILALEKLEAVRTAAAKMRDLATAVRAGELVRRLRGSDDSSAVLSVLADAEDLLSAPGYPDVLAIDRAVLKGDVL